MSKISQHSCFRFISSSFVPASGEGRFVDDTKEVQAVMSAKDVVYIEYWLSLSTHWSLLSTPLPPVYQRRHFSPLKTSSYPWQYNASIIGSCSYVVLWANGKWPPTSCVFKHVERLSGRKQLPTVNSDDDGGDGSDGYNIFGIDYHSIWRLLAAAPRGAGSSFLLFGMYEGWLDGWG